MKKSHLAIVAPIGAGKTTVAKFFEEKGFKLYKLSYAIYDEVEKRGLNQDRKTLQDIGDELRKSEGPDVLAKKAISNIWKEKEQNFVIDSIRNHNELNYLKKHLGKDLLILAIDAPLKIRYKRVIKRRGKYKEQETTFEEFKNIDKRDLGIGNEESEQNVAKCIEMADLRIDNDGSEEKLDRKLEELWTKYFS